MSTTSTIEEISAYDLRSAFQKDEYSYCGKDLIIKGVVTRVGPDMFGLPSIELSDKADGEIYVLCVLPTLDYLNLRKTSKGGVVKVSGETRGLHNNFVVVKHSKVITVSKI